MGKFVFWVFSLYLSLGIASLEYRPFPHYEGVPKNLILGEHFEIHRPDVTLKGVAIGPKNGQPILITPGYFGSAGYLGDLANHLSNYGYRVYVLSLRGKGQGALYSGLKPGFEPREGRFGLDEMVRDKIAVIDILYKHHGTPIVLGGHSLSGILIRAVSVGPSLGGENHREDARIRRRLKDRVLYAPILKSPSPTISKADELGIEMTRFQKLRMLKAHLYITTLAPAFSKLRDSNLSRKLEQLLSHVPFIDALAKLGLKSLDLLNSDIMASKDLGKLKAYDALRIAMAQRLEQDIVSDLDRIIKNGFHSRKGLDYAKAYLRSETAQDRFPIDLISGSDDTLALKEFNIFEAKLLGLKHYVVGRSHMEGIIGEPSFEIAKIIHRRTQHHLRTSKKLGCSRYFN